MTIHKYPLRLDDEQIVLMPEGATILSCADQRGTLCLWAEVNPDAPREARKILVAGTGLNLPLGRKKHLGTVVMGAFGLLVVHVYELLPPSERV